MRNVAKKVLRNGGLRRAIKGGQRRVVEGGKKGTKMVSKQRSGGGGGFKEGQWKITKRGLCSE